jgi:hypothetical protein
MSLLAVRTIQIHNYNFTREEARQAGREFISTITSAYPLGLEDEDLNEKTYFVMPGYEHVTKHQPVAGYNSTEASWGLYTTDLFLQPNT